MLTVIHSCGHSQNMYSLEVRAKQAVEKGIRTEKWAENFLKEQTDFFKRNLCPGCFWEFGGPVNQFENSIYFKINGVLRLEKQERRVKEYLFAPA